MGIHLNVLAIVALHSYLTVHGADLHDSGTRRVAQVDDHMIVLCLRRACTRKDKDEDAYRQGYEERDRKAGKTMLLSVAIHWRSKMLMFPLRFSTLISGPPERSEEHTSELQSRRDL